MFLSRRQVREVDRLAIEEYGVPGVVLMENAGRGCAELLLRLGVRGPVVLCCGKGNNGGDGFVMARHLDNQQIPVQILLFGEPGELRGDAASNYQIIARSGLSIQTVAKEAITPDALRRQWQNAEWLVDAIFGTGLSGTVRSPYDVLIESMNSCGRKIFAVDIPSGLDGDTGTPLGAAIKSQHTATFVARKKGFVNPAAEQWLGQVHVLSIGAPRVCLERAAQTTEV